MTTTQTDAPLVGRIRSVLDSIEARRTPIVDRQYNRGAVPADLSDSIDLAGLNLAADAARRLLNVAVNDPSTFPAVALSSAADHVRWLDPTGSQADQAARRAAADHLVELYQAIAFTLGTRQED